MEAERKEANPLYGLIVCGGQSSRMGVDKSLLVYFDKPQRYYLYKMLKKICSDVFLSLNKNQIEKGNYQIIIDDKKYENIGPMSALLSAFERYPNADFLVIGCDYPFIKTSELQELIYQGINENYGISFFNPESQFREPLLGIYKAQCCNNLKEQYLNGNYSLNQFLESVKAKKINPLNIESLKSIDTIEEYNQTIKDLNNK